MQNIPKPYFSSYFLYNLKLLNTFNKEYPLFHKYNHDRTNIQ